MNGWTFRFGRGWMDRIPPDLQTTLRVFSGNDLAHFALVVQVYDELGRPRGGSDRAFYTDSPSHSLEAEVAQALGIISVFVEFLGRPDVSQGGLIFLNKKPGHVIGERSASSPITDTDSLNGLGMFCRAVEGSLTRFQSSCEWAYLAATKNV